MSVAFVNGNALFQAQEFHTYINPGYSQKYNTISYLLHKFNLNATKQLYINTTDALIQTFCNLV